MDELAREIRAMTEEIEDNIRDVVVELRKPKPPEARPKFSWQAPTHSNDSHTRSNDSNVDSNGSNADVNDSLEMAVRPDPRQTTLASLERKIDSVRHDTSELLRRVPEDLTALIEQAKESILIRIDSLIHSNASNDSNHPVEPAKSKDASPKSVRERLEALTPRERSLFRTCFDSGFLTYQELGEKLGLSRIAAKNVVNAILRHPSKTGLLTKRDELKEVRVGVAKEASDAVLSGEEPKAGDHVAHQRH